MGGVYGPIEVAEARSRTYSQPIGFTGAPFT
jgi:hypothetical protein